MLRVPSSRFVWALVLAAAAFGPTPTALASVVSSPTPTPTGMPMITIGGPQPGSVKTRVTAGPAIQGLRLSLTPGMITGRIGDSIMVSLWLNTIGDHDRLVCFGSFRYHLKFIVTDVRGDQSLQTRPSQKYGGIIGANDCDLEPYKQWRYEVPVNEFVGITRPGTYSVTATLDVLTNEPPRRLVLHSNTIELNVTP